MSTTWLTAEARERLAAELEDLVSRAIPEIEEVLETARTYSDPIENAEINAARDELSRLEARADHIRHLLRTARTADAPVSAAVAAEGTVVTVAFAGSEPEDYFIAERPNQVDGAATVSPSAPLGQALLGAAPGDEVSFRTPAGTSLQVKVISIRLP